MIICTIIYQWLGIPCRICTFNIENAIDKVQPGAYTWDWSSESTYFDSNGSTAATEPAALFININEAKEDSPNGGSNIVLPTSPIILSNGLPSERAPKAFA